MVRSDASVRGGWLERVLHTTEAGYCALADVLESVGDVTGDGGHDLAIGAPRFDLTHVRAGSVFVVDVSTPGEHLAANVPLQVLLVFAGPLSAGTLTEADATWKLFSEHARDVFVGSIEVVDVDGDDRDDLVVGAPGYAEGAFAGAVYLLSGAALTH